MRKNNSKKNSLYVPMLSSISSTLGPLKKVISSSSSASAYPSDPLEGLGVLALVEASALSSSALSCRHCRILRTREGGVWFLFWLEIEVNSIEYMVYGLRSWWLGKSNICR